jgi:heat shock protein HslJ
MRKSKLPSIALLLLPLVAAACGDASSSGNTAKLVGRTFLSDSITVEGEQRALVAGTHIRITFYTDRRITASAGCNMLSGAFDTEDGRLVVDELGSTEMGCDAARHAQDEWLASVLTGNATYVLDDARLQLRTADSVLELIDREVADPDRPLVTTVWALDGIVDGSAASSIPAGTSATMVFDGEQVEVAISSCNQITGRVKVTSSTIEVDRIITTDIACNGPSAALEAAIVAVLDGKVAYEIEAASLRLTHSNGKGLTLRAQ